ncbi:MAG: TrbC/VirB2 family protein [Spirochaetaceae bacterium]|nr:TrbC/VirB2 family protein [Spirochaetaceae bacterium]
MRKPINNIKIAGNDRQNVRRVIAVLILMLCCSLVFAQGGTGQNGTTGNSLLDGQITDWTGKLTSFLGSNWVKAIALVALVIEAIGIVIGGQQGGGTQVFKKMAPWIIGTVILLMASGICSYMYDQLDFTMN